MNIIEAIRGRRSQAVGISLDGVAAAARATASGEAVDAATLDRALEATATSLEEFDRLVARCRLRGEDRKLLAAAAAAEAKLPKLGREIDAARQARDRILELHDKPLRALSAEHSALLDATMAGTLARENLFRDPPGQAGVELTAATAEWKRAEVELSQLQRDAADGKKEAEHFDQIAEQQEQRRPQAGWVDASNRSAARAARRRSDKAAAALPDAEKAAQAARDRLRQAQAAAIEA